MNPVFELLTRTRSRTLVARSLFLWHRIVGESCEAVPLLRQLSGIIIALPLGGEIVTHKLPINACPTGFDVQPRALPNADALFANIPQSGLTLEMSAEMPPRPAPGQIGGVLPTMRRLRVVDQYRQTYRRRGAERFMLRYRLDPAVLQAKDLLFLQVARDPGSVPSLLPPLRVWIEIDDGESCRLIETDETSASVLVEGEAIWLSSFPVGNLALPEGAPAPRGVQIYLELTGDLLDAMLIGETLLS